VRELTAPGREWYIYEWTRNTKSEAESVAKAKDRDALNAEIVVNYKAFSEMLPRLLAENEGKFCLLRHGEIIEFFDTANDAYLLGSKRFSDGLFSIQEVSDTPVDLGFFSHAVPGS
jgi:hypothetical protein